MRLRSVLQRNRPAVALVIGNGVNRYGAPHSGNSWDSLLRSMGDKYLGRRHAGIREGISLPEFYDLLDLARGSVPSSEGLQSEFCARMAGWKPVEHHRRIVEWAQKARAPILTTNFESTLGQAGGCSLHHLPNTRFTDYYPWSSYYAKEAVDSPTSGFGIWHINGMQHYRRSIRLGLTHYMGAVARARGLIQKSGGRPLFAEGPSSQWAGSATWLDIVFHKPLLVFGLALEENETFLRWLLIERAKYFSRFPSRRKDAWYVHLPAERGSGKLYFLERLGFTPLQAPDYDDIYGADTWNG
ncbi:MAG: hypothetical protein HXY18_00090 [Bryobacteraceae bacterium]|nr:hypothetical protein [Bryobacteraceae bacterium]